MVNGNEGREQKLWEGGEGERRDRSMCHVVGKSFH